MYIICYGALNDLRRPTTTFFDRVRTSPRATNQGTKENPTHTANAKTTSTSVLRERNAHCQRKNLKFGQRKNSP